MPDPDAAPEAVERPTLDTMGLPPKAFKAGIRAACDASERDDGTCPYPHCSCPDREILRIARNVMFAVAQALPAPTTTADAAEAERYREALERIADEEKIYTGHGNYDVAPALTAEEAQKIARTALGGAA